MATEEKIREVAALKEKLAKAQNIIVTDHTGITVEDLTVLRRQLRQVNAEFRVAKNTLLKRAAEESAKTELVRFFRGPTSLVFGYDDPSAPARIIHETRKKLERPAVKGFFWEGRLLGPEELQRLAELPPRAQVLAGLTGAIIGPIAGFVFTLQGVIRQFIGLVDALAERRKEPT